MRVQRTADQFLGDILEWSGRVAKHLHNVTLEEFLESDLLQDAVTKCIENIGEAAIHATRLDPSLTDKYPDFQAGYAYSARNAVSHGCFNIDNDIVWFTASNSVPQMARVVRRILNDRAKGQAK